MWIQGVQIQLILTKIFELFNNLLEKTLSNVNKS